MKHRAVFVAHPEPVSTVAEYRADMVAGAVFLYKRFKVNAVVKEKPFRCAKPQRTIMVFTDQLSFGLMVGFTYFMGFKKRLLSIGRKCKKQDDRYFKEPFQIFCFRNSASISTMISVAIF